MRSSLEVKSRKRKESVAAITKSASVPKELKFPPMFGMANYMPTRSTSEDDSSIDNHKKWLSVESTKKRPSCAEVSTRMNLTFPDRRREIIKGLPIQEVKTVYPWLFRDDGDEVKITACCFGWWRFISQVVFKTSPLPLLLEIT